MLWPKTTTVTALHRGTDHTGCMEIAGWDERYRSKIHAEDFNAEPTPLVVEMAGALQPGTALDLACGTGRNALWLARRGWRVTAVDGSAAAIETLRQKASDFGVTVDARVADLQRPEYEIARAQWDLVTICYYLQRDLFEPAKQGVKPGGVLIAIVHTTEGGEAPTQSRLKPGELVQYFEGWEVLHSYEGRPNDLAHRRAVAEIVARRFERSQGNGVKP